MNSPPSIAGVIKAQAKIKKIQTGTMLSECGLNKNALSNMQAQGTYPSIETITKIADYLDCSIDFLLGRSDNPESHKSTAGSGADPLTDMLLEVFGQLSDGDKFKVIGEAKNLLETWHERSVAADREAPEKTYPSSGTEGESSKSGVQTA